MKMNWNPKKTLKEMQDDPWRAGRAVGTGGLSELDKSGIPVVGDIAKGVAGIGDRVDATFNPQAPNTSQEDADIAAAQALYGQSVEDFLRAGPERYEVGPEFQSGVPLEFQNLSVGDQLALQQMGAFDQLGPSEMAAISTDPRYRDAELSALTDLEQQSKTGFTARDEADLAKLEGEVNRQNRGRLGAIQQNMASRGMSGSGMDIAAQIAASQDATERQALAALEKNAQMGERKQDATSRLGSLASQLQGRDFNQAATKAQAADAIARFNTANSIDRTKLNTGIANQGIQANWQRGNQVSDQNVGINNTAKQANWGRANQVGDMNTQRKQQVGDQNVDSQGKFNRNALGAKQGQAIFQGDAATDRYNRKMGAYADKTNRRDMWTEKGIDALIQGGSAAYGKYG
jgi:hypothetical protein